jgi:hypothetical protein
MLFVDSSTIESPIDLQSVISNISDIISYSIKYVPTSKGLFKPSNIKSEFLLFLCTSKSANIEDSRAAIKDSDLDPRSVSFA